MKKKYVAIVLAAGQGRRMNSSTQKQFLLIKNKPVLYYSLLEFERSLIDEIVLVTSSDSIEYCKAEIVDKYGFDKVKTIVAGGKERYHSVMNGITAVEACDYLLIHDGARPFINQEIISRTVESVEKYQACVVGMPVKDTIKIVDEEEFAVETPARDKLWMIQTPQAFQFDLIKDAYAKLIGSNEINVTDDAMVVEYAMNQKVKLIEGSYKNIKITTPEDLLIAQVFCE